MKRILSFFMAAVLCVAAAGGLSLTTHAEAATPNLSIVACNLSFRESVYIKYAVYAENASRVSLLIFTAGDGDYTYENAAAQIDTYTTETVAGRSCLVFAYTELSAKQLTDDIYARAYCEEDGNVVYSAVRKYSILQYAYNKLGKTGEAGSENLQTLLRDMLAYGAAAQRYFDYRTDRLADAEYYGVTLTGGTFADGCGTGLFAAGDEVTVTAPVKNDAGHDFARWRNAAGVTVATSPSFTYTVPAQNAALTAIYGEETPTVLSSFTACEIATDDLDVFRYWLYTPADPTENMPLIVYLHGGSGKGSDLSLITDADGFPKYLQEGRLGDVRAYVIMPQVPADKKGWTDVGASLLALIRAVRTAYGIDADNVSLTGHSMGGTGTWGIALAYPATFARIAPLSGSVQNTTINVNKLKNLPVRAFVGAEDTIVAPASSENFVAALQAAGGDAEIVSFAGATHFDVPALVYLDEEIDLVAWLTGEE